MQFWIVYSVRITCALVMIVRLDQKTKHAKLNEKKYEFQKYALHESIVIVLHFNGTSSVWAQIMAQYLVRRDKIPFETDL